MRAEFSRIRLQSSKKFQISIARSRLIAFPVLRAVPMAGPFLSRIRFGNLRLPRWCTVLLFCTALGAALACAGPEIPEDEIQGQGEGPGHRSQVLGLSPQQELQLGRQSEKQVLANP